MDLKFPVFTAGDIKPLKNINLAIAESNYASEFCTFLLQSIQEFDSNLDNDSQVALRLVSFGQTVTFAVHSIGYSNPSLIYFYGVMPDGSNVQLIQHVSQISFLLTTTIRDNPNEPKQLIGFRTDQ